jgi:hypothetical protein
MMVLKILEQTHHDIISLSELLRTPSKIFQKLSFHIFLLGFHSGVDPLSFLGRWWSHYLGRSLDGTLVFSLRWRLTIRFLSHTISRDSSTSAYASVALHSCRRRHNSHYSKGIGGGRSSRSCSASATCSWSSSPFYSSSPSSYSSCCCCCSSSSSPSE